MTKDLDPLWLRAAAVGSLWAAAEIIIGSALHNLHVPLAGLALSAGAVCLLVAVYHLRPQPGLIMRAGLICALMKALSPSAIILGPMVAILMESLLLEGMIRLLGANPLGYMIGGALAVSWSLIHKLASLFVIYGPHLVELYVKLFQYAARQFGLSNYQDLPWYLLWGLLGLSLFSGAGFALLGMYLGALARKLPAQNLSLSLNRPCSPKSFPSRKDFCLGLLLFHFLMLILGLAFLERLPLPLSGLAVLLYVSLVLWRYREGLRPLKRPGFWLILLSLTLLAGLFLGKVETFGSSWSLQGLEIGLEMALRALLMVMAFRALSIELRHPRLKHWFESHGLSPLSQTLPWAFEALPLMIASLSKARHEILSRPFHTLASLIKQVEHLESSLVKPKNPFLLVTGGRGVGKTSALERAIDDLRQRGLKVGGLLSLGFWKDGEREGFKVMDILSGRCVPLCHREKGDLSPGFGHFLFSKEGLTFGLEALSPERLKEVDLIIVDEVGPLELQGGGWAKALDFLKDFPKPQVWVVREELIAAVCERWGLKNVHVHRVEGPEDLRLVELILDIMIFSFHNEWKGKRRENRSRGPSTFS